MRKEQIKFLSTSDNLHEGTLIDDFVQGLIPSILQSLLSVRSLDQRYRYGLGHCRLGRDWKRHNLRLHSTEDLKCVRGKQAFSVQRGCLGDCQISL